MASRAFEVAATTLGVQCTPPDATMTALGLPLYAAGGRLYSMNLRFHNAGDDYVEIRTSVTEAPVLAADATITRKRLAPGDSAVMEVDIGDASHDQGYGTHQFFAFADGGTQNLVVDPV
jgi:hypothetical protein